MGRSISNVPFGKLSLAARVEAVEEYVLDNKEILFFNGLCGFFKCGPKMMYEVVEKAGFCLLPKSYHSANKVLKIYRSGERDVGAIAEELGFSRKAVYHHIQKLSEDLFIEVERKGDIKRKKVDEAYRSGCRTCVEIGERMGMKRGDVWYHKNKLGLPQEKKGRPIGSKGKTVNKERNNLILSGDYGVVEIAEMENVSRQAVCQYIIYCGLRERYREARIGKGFKV